MQDVEAPKFPTPDEHRFLAERGYEPILGEIQVFASRKQGVNYGKNYFGIGAEGGSRQFIAWCGGVVPTYEEWNQRQSYQVTPMEKKVNDHDIALTRLATELFDLKNEVRLLKAACAPQPFQILRK